MSAAKALFQETERERLAEVIRAAEARTSGEIRVYVEDNCPGATLERAKEIFFQLGIDKTESKNGTLIYLAVESHKFAVLGDEGIDRVVPADFWESIKTQMALHFSHRDFFAGIAAGIMQIGEKLKEFFPRADDDVNELPDEVVIG